MNFMFSAKELDKETGFYYYGARYLDPKYSRWISTDPAMNTGEYFPVAPVSDEARQHNGNLPGMGGIFNHINGNLFAYAGNNPIKYTDPDGRSSREDEIAKQLGDKSKTKQGVNLNFFPKENNADYFLTSTSGEKIYTRTIADRLYRYKSLYYVGAHGSRTSVLSFGKDGTEEKGTRLTPEKLAEIIKNDKDYHNQPVVLLVCETGADPENVNSKVDSFAQQLANCLGEDSIVIASVGYCGYDTYITEDGRYKIRTYEVNPGEQYVFRGKKNEE